VGFAQPHIDQGTEVVDKNISDHLTSISRIEIDVAARDILAGTQMEDARGGSSSGQPIGWCQDTKNAVGQDGPARAAGRDPICGWLPASRWPRLHLLI
jgi:hypothetical protein